MRSKESKTCRTKKQKSGHSYDFINSDTNKFEFVGLYKTAAETKKILDDNRSSETIRYDDNINSNVLTSKRERSPYKNRKKRKQEIVEISEVNIDGSSLNATMGANAQVNNTSKSSTKEQAGNVKSIMKNASGSDQTIDSSTSNKSSGKPKKRNKSVSFMLDDNEEIVVKRTKSDDSIQVKYENIKDNKKKIIKKSKKSEKENTVNNVNKQNMDIDNTLVSAQEKSTVKTSKAKNITESTVTPAVSDGEVDSLEKRKRIKKVKKQKAKVNPQLANTDSEKDTGTEVVKMKKHKKKKIAKLAAAGTEEENREPVSKSRKMESKPDIVEDLENLSIGDNAHTLTNLLDEMTVVDKDKQKKLRQKFNKKTRSKGPNKEKSEIVGDGNEKGKIKWNKRKWNKDKKGFLDEDMLATTVVIENLPLKIMLTYKKLLTEHFIKYGLIKKIGIAEVYPTEESKPVFTTTINFYSDSAATQSLELNNTEFEGNRIRVKQSLPPTATTVVVRSYAELTDQNISSAFLGAGKIRSIKHLVKGKKSMSTAFVEFDGPEAVKCALKKMADNKIGGKKIHVAKFEPRSKKKKVKDQKNDGDSAADADSEDSND